MVSRLSLQKSSKESQEMEAKLFWEEWLQANKPRRLQMIKGLPIFRKHKPDYKRLTPTRLNSYFSDLEREVRKGI